MRVFLLFASALTASAFVVPKPAATTTTHLALHKPTIEETLANLCQEEDLECELDTNDHYETTMEELAARKEEHMQQARTIRKLLTALDEGNPNHPPAKKKCFDVSAWKGLNP